MVRQTETEDITSAWRALAGDVEREGWRTIALAEEGRCRILAGRHFPGNEEAVLVGLFPALTPYPAVLPAGNGFVVKPVDLGTASEGRAGFGLVRQPAGRLDFFAMMSNDIIANLTVSVLTDDSRLLALFLDRVRAWQSFMERDREGVLGAEAEVGLHGELVVLQSILESGVSPSVAVQAWIGPLDGIQDFQFTGGSIEVKATTSSGTFPATISSLEQLDETLVNPLFLAGVKLDLAQSGKNLPARAENIRHLLQKDPTALSIFDIRLLHAGFFPAFSDRYPRSFAHDITKFFQVHADFPRLTHGVIPTPIRKARYEIDLDLVTVEDISLSVVLTLTGAL